MLAADRAVMVSIILLIDGSHRQELAREDYPADIRCST
jgi:hypothetical protein